MAKMKTAIYMPTETIGLGPVEFPAGMLATLAPESETKTGIVLANERVNFAVTQEDGTLVNFTASIYIQREAVTDEEKAKVSATAAERDAAKAKREKDEQDKQAREKKAAFELGQTSTMHALRNLGDLAAGAAALAHIVK